MATGSDLREFLTSRRAAIAPEAVGLPATTVTRRVPGLRREEVAILAGVSVDYYIKFEQGKATNVSEQVLESIERVLHLDELERRHLRSLIRPKRSAPAALADSRPKARAAVLNMIDTLSVPAVVHGPILEVLGMNALAQAVFDDFGAMPVEERNLARWMFLNPKARDVYIEWELHAAQMAAILRAAANGPRCRSLEALVGELTIESPEFAHLWSNYQLFEHVHGVKQIRNNVVGDLTLNYETMPLVADQGQTLMLYSADFGSPTAEKLQLLSSWISEPTRAQ
jgi:transcriptional regulator with XRE-family HTH domain